MLLTKTRPDLVISLCTTLFCKAASVMPEMELPTHEHTIVVSKYLREQWHRPCGTKKMKKILATVVTVAMVLLTGCSLFLPDIRRPVINIPIAIHSQDPQQSPIKDNSNDIACKFPILDPFDPSILSFIEHPPPLVCKTAQPEFRYTDGYVMKVNESVAVGHELRDIQYRSIIRKSEAQIAYGNWQSWNFAETPSVYLFDPVEVIGTYGGSAERYLNLHSSIHISRDILKKKKAKMNGKRKPNVMVLALESLSRGNFVRNLPKTLSVLAGPMNATIFHGYTKIADNSAPNILAVLTGYILAGHAEELPIHRTHQYVDGYPFVWKNFAAKGYVTGYADEQDGILAYEVPGVEKVPTDWYFRPFGMALNQSPLRELNTSYDCIGNRLVPILLLDSVARFIKTRHKDSTPYFLFSMLWRTGHRGLNEHEKIDGRMAEWFEMMFSEGYFDNTFVFVFGDHGNRFDTIRRTLVGRYEERMPFLSVHVPTWFSEKYPTAMDRLHENAWRLTSNFDVYETLIDIALDEYGNENRPRLKNRGYSLFSTIPKSRTCADAGIHPHFCVCQEEEEVDITKSKMVRPAVEYAMEKINSDFLGKYKLLCEELTLDRIISAQKFKANDNVKYGIYGSSPMLPTDKKNVTDVIAYLRVTFSTNPNRGLYEASVQYHEDETSETDSFKPTGIEMSRINKYGSDGDCVKAIDSSLGRFCYCKRREPGGKAKGPEH